MQLGLNKKIIIVGVTIMVFFIIMLWLSNRIVEQLSNDVELSTNIGQLNQLTALMKESSAKYRANAPRDYESYNRDLKVFYTGLQDQLATLDTLVEITTHDFFNRNTTANFLISDDILESNNKAFIRLSDLNVMFEKGLAEKIGDNPEEPRLEWANEYISDDVSQLFAHIDDTEQRFNALSLAHRDATITFNRFVSITVALVLVLLIVWFNQTIIKRVIRVAKACREVSLGNYGLKLKDKNQDEISQLVSDFNNLSGRLKSILSLLNEVHKTSTAGQAVNVIQSEIKNIVNTSMVMLLLPKSKTYRVVTTSSDAVNNDLAGKQLVATDASISWVSNNESHYLSNDILADTIKHQNTHFLKYLLQSTGVNSVYIINIQDGQHQGLMVFTKLDKNGFKQQDTDAIKGLKSLFSNVLLSKQ